MVMAAIATAFVSAVAVFLAASATTSAAASLGAAGAHLHALVHRAETEDRGDDDKRSVRRADAVLEDEEDAIRSVEGHEGEEDGEDGESQHRQRDRLGLDVRGLESHVTIVVLVGILVCAHACSSSVETTGSLAASSGWAARVPM